MPKFKKSGIITFVKPKKRGEKRNETVKSVANRKSRGGATPLSRISKGFGKGEAGNAVSNSVAALRYYQSANYAFTLAEVLITIGVIGIVAAIAIPSLINHYNDKVLETRYQRSKNILVNGYKLMMAKEQVFDIKDLSVRKCQDMDCFVSAHKEVFKTVRDSSSSDISEAFASDYTIPGVPEKLDISSNASQAPTFQTTDGMSYMVITGLNPSHGAVQLFADLNGKSKPNVIGEDLFMFGIYGNGIFFDLTDAAFFGKLSCNIFTPEGCTTEGSCQALNNGYSGKGCFVWGGSRCSFGEYYCR